MADARDTAELEPFGQRSARGLIRFALLFFCGIAVIVSTFMLVRSGHSYESLTLVYGGRRYEVASAFDRLAIILSEPRAGEIESLEWIPRSIPIENVVDAWQPSWLKTIGVQFGAEPDRTAERPGVIVRRLRVRWRTLIFAYSAPLLLALIRRRAARRQQDVDADPATLPATR